MPALNFQKQFASAVERGEKCQAIRAPRRDGRPTATIGSTVYLYTGMRTKGCRKLGEGTVTRTEQFVINEDRLIIVGGEPIRSGREEDKFARADGFENAYQMCEWFRETHDLPFHGTLIEWKRTAVAVEAA